MRPIRFALCSDLHCDLVPDGRRRLKEFLEFAERRKADFIIHLGDFCYANERNRDLAEAWGAAGRPAYQVLGNHDMDHNTKQQAVEFLGMPAPFYSFDAGEVHCIAADPNHLALAGGLQDYGFGNYFAHPAKLNWLGDAQLEWLRADLEGTDKKTIVFSHQSLADPVFGARDSERLQEIFRRENARCGRQKVIACMNGHDHTDGVRVQEGVYYISVNSLSFFYMSSDINVVRYSQQITEQYPILREAAPYREPLYTLVSVTDEAIFVEGRDTEFVGPAPRECGHCGHAGGHPATACIRPRELRLAAGGNRA